MGSENLILHQYDISPFSQKAQKMMALKGLSWLSIEMPMIAPKPDVEALTGGYRGTPVLQIGADVFIDNWMIARAIDQFAPDRPPINARGALGDAALYAWGEHLFIPLLHSALATYKGRWDANFLADRKQVFPDVDFDTLEVGDPDRCSQVRAYLGAVQAQLAVSGSFLGGAEADSWDIHVWGMVWMIYGALPDLVPIVEAFPALVAWYQRVEALGIGAREDVTMEVAWDALRNGQTQRLPDTPVEEPLSDWLGHAVHISAGSADRGSVAGRLLAVDHEQAVLAVEPLSGFEAQVWFPRFGYHLSKGAC
ncbi:glutathione S-transferase [Luminiphilus sp.]|nr:glutathione S-transferase [Luminiphilus sp.]